MCRSEGVQMPGRGHASSYLAARQGRVEPELRPSTAPRTPYPTDTSDIPTAPGLSGMVPEIDPEPRLSDLVCGEAPPTSGSSRLASAERLHIGGMSYLLLLGLAAAATIGVFFGLAFFLLTPPNDKPVVDAGSASSRVEEARDTARGTMHSSDAPATSVASAEITPAPDATSRAPDSPAPSPGLSPPPAAVEFAGPPGEAAHPATEGRRNVAHSVAHRGRSGHNNRRRGGEELASQAAKQRILSAAMDRAHRENLLDSSESLTPPKAGARNPFDRLITQLTRQTKPAPPLTPLRTEQP
jgi:hypothetical protein